MEYKRFVGDGDGWVFCPDGHRHWGRFGAAGLLLGSAEGVVLQHRAERTHEGGTWALPGGARDSHEDPVQTALREAGEEAGIDPAQLRPSGWSVAQHGGWSYTTVLAEAVGLITPFAANWESQEVRWWDRGEVEKLPLHPAFARAWPELRTATNTVTVIVDTANVVGSRPDGWWRDRAGATERLHEAVLELAHRGSNPAEFGHFDTNGLAWVLPRYVMVVEGAARAATLPSSAPQWWQRQVEVVRASGAGDDVIVELAHATAKSAIVVTADRGLRRRLPRQAEVAGPNWLYTQLDAS